MSTKSTSLHDFENNASGFSHDAMGSLPNGETDLALADNAQPSFSTMWDGTETIDSLLLLLVAMVGNVVVCSGSGMKCLLLLIRSGGGGSTITLVDDFCLGLDGRL